MIKQLFSKEIRLETEYIKREKSERIPKIKSNQYKTLKTEGFPNENIKNIRKTQEIDSIYSKNDKKNDKNNRKTEEKASNSQSFIDTVNEINDEIDNLIREPQQLALKVNNSKSNQSTIEKNIYKINNFIRKSKIQSAESEYFNKEILNLTSRLSNLKATSIILKNKSETIKNSISENKIRLNQGTSMLKDLLFEYNSFNERNQQLENQLEDMKVEGSRLNRIRNKNIFEGEEKGLLSKSKLENLKKEKEIELKMVIEEYEEMRIRSKEVKEMLDKEKKELLYLRRVLKEKEYKTRGKSREISGWEIVL